MCLILSFDLVNYMTGGLGYQSICVRTFTVWSIVPVVTGTACFTLTILNRASGISINEIWNSATIQYNINYTNLLMQQGTKHETLRCICSHDPFMQQWWVNQS